MRGTAKSKQCKVMCLSCSSPVLSVAPKVCVVHCNIEYSRVSFVCCFHNCCVLAFTFVITFPVNIIYPSFLLVSQKHVVQSKWPKDVCLVEASAAFFWFQLFRPGICSSWMQCPQHCHLIQSPLLGVKDLYLLQTFLFLSSFPSLVTKNRYS